MSSMDSRWPFFTVDLELTNVCNQNCLFCPRDQIKRPFGFIELPLFSRIATQLAEIGSRVTFCGMGNPLLHPAMPEIAAICQKTGLKYGLTIQAPALDPDSIAKIDLLHPAFIEVSFPTVDSELFSTIFPGQSFAMALNGLALLIKARGSTRGITITAVRTAKEAKSIDEVASFWSSKTLFCRQPACHSRGGNLKNSSLVMAQTGKTDKCGLFATHAFITWQGHLLACCHDLSEASKLADLSEVSVKEAAQRKVAVSQGIMPYSMCANCDEPAARRSLPDRAFPESEKARGRYLRRHCRT